MSKHLAKTEFQYDVLQIKRAISHLGSCKQPSAFVCIQKKFSVMTELMYSYVFGFFAFSKIEVSKVVAKNYSRLLSNAQMNIYIDSVRLYTVFIVWQK